VIKALYVFSISRTESIVYRSDDPDRNAREQLPDDAGVPQRIQHHFGRIIQPHAL
jgi:hypothetical protein